MNVGLGFHVEFTLPEAIAFIDKKEAHLTKYGILTLLSCFPQQISYLMCTRKAEELTESAGAIRARIQLISFYVFFSESVQVVCAS